MRNVQRVSGWLSRRRRVTAGVVAALVVALAVYGVSRRGPAEPAHAAVAAPPVVTASPAVPAPRASTVPPPTTTTLAAPTTVPVPTTRAALAGGGLAVGDSVLEDVQLYAPATLASRGISFNAAVSRQWQAGETILSSVRAAGKLPPVVIVALGTNGAIRAEDFDAMMRAAAGSTKVVFMTVTGPCIANNPVIAAGVARYPQARLADWAAVSAAHADWFARDRVHVGPAGAAALGALLASVI
jgi:hypothetical protein